MLAAPRQTTALKSLIVHLLLLGNATLLETIIIFMRIRQCPPGPSAGTEPVPAGRRLPPAAGVVQEVPQLVAVGEYSRRLAAFLGQAGYDAANLAGGVVGWRDGGLPLESGPPG
jgi:hypothetical protein